MSQTDPVGNLTSYAFDAQSRPIRTLFADGTQRRTLWKKVDVVATEVDARGVVKEHAYDVAERRASCPFGKRALKWLGSPASLRQACVEVARKSPSDGRRRWAGPPRLTRASGVAPKLWVSSRLAHDSRHHRARHTRRAQARPLATQREPSGSVPSEWLEVPPSATVDDGMAGPAGLAYVTGAAPVTTPTERPWSTRARSASRHGRASRASRRRG